MKKTMILIAAMIAAVFMASSAMALDQEARPELMFPFALCDQAGTLKITFTLQDYNTIQDWLITEQNPYVVFEILLGTGLDPSIREPILCKDITGKVYGPDVGLPVGPGGLFYLHLNDTNQFSGDVSDVCSAAGADVSAYVVGRTGDRSFYIYIVAIDPTPVTGVGIQNSDDWSDPTELPYIIVGLDNTASVTAPTVSANYVAQGGSLASPVLAAICVDVREFTINDLLIVSNDALPDRFTYNTSDDRIGIFKGQIPFIIADCVTKADLATCPTTTSIELCEPETVDQQTQCPTYYHCFIVTGFFDADEYDSGEMIEFELRVDGPDALTPMQTGIALINVTWNGPTMYDLNNVATGAATRFLADGATVEPYGPCVSWNGVVMKWRAQGRDLTAPSIRFCVTYSVNYATAVAGTNVTFWLTAVDFPCGIVYSFEFSGALLKPCGSGVNTCIYFPYVIFGDDEGWATGIAITNVGKAATPANMVVTYTLRDKANAKFTKTVTGYTQIMEVQTVDEMVTNYGWSPLAGCGWLRVDANFLIDGYLFNLGYVQGLVFGAGHLPRLFCNQLLPTVASPSQME